MTNELPQTSNRMLILRDLHNNIWDMIKHLIRMETLIVFLILLIDLIMLPIMIALKSNIPALFVAALFVITMGVIFSIYLINNRRIHKNQIAVLRQLYVDLQFESISRIRAHPNTLCATFSTLLSSLSAP